jgi:hypothetical protein
MNCLIWGTPAKPEPIFGDNTTLDSPRAGGKYIIAGSASAMAPDLPVQKKMALTTWLCNQRRLGVPVPKINEYNLAEITSGARLIVSERINRALLFIANEIPRVDQKFQFDPKRDTLSRFQAEAECEDGNEAGGLIQLMERMGLLTLAENSADRWQVSPEGWMRVEELTARASDSTQGFVAMWFDEAVKLAWTDGIKPAIEGSGYRALRIDNVEHNGKVDDRIIAEIRRSRFLVADFSCEEKKVRGGVYYEAGFAEGISIPIFWTCRKESIDDLHFDTRQYNHIIWTNPAELREKLTNRIRAVLGQGPVKLS